MSSIKSYFSASVTPRRTALAAALVLGLVGAVTYVVVNRHQELTEAPAIEFSKDEIQPPLSSVTFPVTADLVAIGKTLNARAPTEYTHTWKDSVRYEEEISIPYPCVKHWKLRTCHKVSTIRSPKIPYQGDARVSRPGPVELVGRGDEIEVRVPLAFWVRIAGRGSLGSKVHETAEGRFVLATRIKATVDRNWTLQLAAAPTIEWQGQPGGKLFNLVDYTIKSLVQDKLEDGMADLLADLEKEANVQLALRSNAEGVWTAAFGTHAIPGMVSTWAVVRPETVAWSPLAFNNDTLSTALRLTMRTEVAVGGEAPSAPAATPLPTLAIVAAPSPQGQMDLHTPLRLSYQELASYTMELASSAPALKEAGVTVNDIKFYPAGDRLAVRVDANVDVPGHWFDTRAVIFLVGTPALDPTSNTLKLDRLSLSRKVDNTLVDAIELPLHELVEDALERKLRTRMAPVVDEANGRIQTALKPLSKQGALLSVHIDSVKLGATHLMQDAAVIPVHIQGVVSATLDADQLARR